MHLHIRNRSGGRAKSARRCVARKATVILRKLGKKKAKRATMRSDIWIRRLGQALSVGSSIVVLTMGQWLRKTLRAKAEASRER